MDIANIPYVINVLELAAAILAIVHYKKYKYSKERYFICLLWFTILVEIVGAIWGYMHDGLNFWVYNVYMFTSFLFYFYWYYSILLQKYLRAIVLGFALVFVIVSAWNFIFQNWDGYHKYTFVTGAFFTMICTLFHFRQLLYSDEVLILKHKLSFWISTGLLLFNMGMIPLMLLQEYFIVGSDNYYGITILILNVILYGCYITGFQWAKEKYNRF